MRRALITGATGQDGSYLAELLLDKKYEVHGLIRKGTEGRLDPRVIAHLGDLTDPASLHLAVAESQPDEIYHLGAQSHVGASFEWPEYTWEATALGTTRMLEAARRVCPKARFYQASSSEMFGLAESPQNEKTPFHPRSPYAIAKVAAYHTSVLYREAYGMFVTNGILQNHESERRQDTFVTRKITKAVARIALGQQKKLRLGNLDAERDWGHAQDYVRAMWLMLQHETPDDFVIATGEMHSVREFLRRAFSRAGLTWTGYVEVDPALHRPADVPSLRGDSTKARKMLGWRPTIDFETLVNRMVDHDLAQARRFTEVNASVRVSSDRV